MTNFLLDIIALLCIVAVLPMLLLLIMSSALLLKKLWDEVKRDLPRPQSNGININFKDLPPDWQKRELENAGIDTTPWLKRKWNTLRRNNFL